MQTLIFILKLKYECDILLRYTLKYQVAILEFKNYAEVNPMNNLADLSMNIIIVTNAKTKDEAFSEIKKLYSGFTQDNRLDDFNNYAEYAEYEENRMKSDVDRNMATIVSPFTIVDLLDSSEVSLLHCGDYTRKTKFNSLDKSIYAMDNIYEVYGCLRPDVEIEDLEEIESVEYIVSRLGGNIVILSNRASMPKIVRDKLAENSVETFNPFK